MTLELFSSSSETQIAPYLDTLNEQQLKGALHFKGPILILAGAGSGKTRVLTHRVAHLIDYYRVPPYNILAVTFTNKAAGEMKKRLAQLLGDRGNRVLAATFHSLGLRILRRHAAVLGYTNDFVVYDQQDAKSLLKEITKELKVDEAKYPVAYLQRAIESAKSKGLTSDSFSESLSNYADSIVGAVYDRYQRELLKNNAMDFSDLLFNTLKLLKEHKEVLQRYQSDFQFVLVDEFQDTNGIQYEIIRLLAAPQNNLLAVGDDDQSIYAFRGATIENIMNFERDFPEAVVIALEQNYRSTQHILDSANAVIAKNRERRAKTLWTEGDRGAPLRGYVASDENEEAAFVAREIRSTWKSGRPLSEIAVFYRTNAQSRALEDALMAEGVPYRIYGGLKFYDRKEIKDVLAYLRLVINEADSQAFYRCINTPPRGIGAKAVETIRQKAQVEDTSLYEATKQLQSQSKSLANFVSLIEELRALAKKEALYDLISETVERSTYGPKLRSLKDVTALSRLENLEELRAIATTMTYVGESPEEDLRLFLDRVSLTSGEELPVEEARDASLRNQQEDGIPVPNQPSPPAEPPDTVSLMTLHLAKGLEYPIVFLTGLEEGLLPHYRSLESEFEISEERRLCYVGMTRAMNKLYLSRAERRGMFSAGGAFNGGFGAREASRFIFDIPETCFDSDSRHFASTGFHLGAAQFDYGQELTLEHVKRLRAQQHGTKRDSFKANPSALISQTISTADSLSNAGISADEFSKLTQAAFDDLKIGTRVIHRTFGPGEVIEVQENENVEKSKIVVQFENFELSKKLLFRHAKLAVLP